MLEKQNASEEAPELSPFLTPGYFGEHHLGQHGDPLGLDVAVEEGGLQVPGERVGHQHGGQDRQRVRDLSGQLEHDHRDGDGVADGARQRRAAHAGEPAWRGDTHIQGWRASAADV